MALSNDELALIAKHQLRLGETSATDELFLRYYKGAQRIKQLGMAIPPSFRRFLVIANWCRTVVDTTNSRQQVRALVLHGDEVADPLLRDIWDASNMTAHTSMFNLDRMIYGRSFMSVGSNEVDAKTPLVRVESPREMTAFIDPRTEVLTSACRFSGWEDGLGGVVPMGDMMQTWPSYTNPTKITLYKRNETVAAALEHGQWVEVDRDEHNLGVVPVVMHLNRRLSGSWIGESQMTDVIPLADSAARSLTNLQFAQEAHGIPRMYMTGVAKGDFVDADNKPIPQFEAYFDAIHMLSKENAKVGQLDAADLKNFETSLKMYGSQASIVTGFPSRYFGITTANPPAEGAIHADESTLNRSVEEQNEQLGISLGQVGALAYRFSTGGWPDKRRVHVDWFDPATPTVSQREDALAKRRAAGVLSREGYWDELGWSAPRKDREREYLRKEREELMDPYLARLSEKDTANATANAAVNGGRVRAGAADGDPGRAGSADAAVAPVR
jgi:hypothetical protein